MLLVRWMRRLRFALVPMIAAAACYAGPDIDASGVFDLKWPYTAGERGAVAFAYETGCVGEVVRFISTYSSDICALDEPLVVGGTAHVALWNLRAGNLDAVTARSSSESVMRISQSESAPSAYDPGQRYIDVTGVAPGVAFLELVHDDGTVFDRLSIEVSTPVSIEAPGLDAPGLVEPGSPALVYRGTRVSVPFVLHDAANRLLHGVGVVHFSLSGALDPVPPFDYAEDYDRFFSGTDHVVVVAGAEGSATVTAASIDQSASTTFNIVGPDIIEGIDLFRFGGEGTDQGAFAIASAANGQPVRSARCDWSLSGQGVSFAPVAHDELVPCGLSFLWNTIGVCGYDHAEVRFAAADSSGLLTCKIGGVSTSISVAPVAVSE